MQEVSACRPSPSSPVSSSTPSSPTAPVHASRLGLTEYDDQLDDLSEAAFERRRQTDASWLDSLSRGRPDRSGLRRRDRSRPGDQHPRRPPDRRRLRDVAAPAGRRTSTPASPGSSALFLHRLRPMAELVDAAISRLQLIPGNLEDGTRNLRPEMVPAIFLERAANQARAGARYVRELLPAQVEDPDALRAARGGGRRDRIGLRVVRRLPRGHEAERHRRVGTRGASVQRAAAREGAARLRRARAARTRTRGLRRARRRADALRARAARHRRLEVGPRRAQRGPPDHAGGDAHRLRGLDRAGAGSSCARTSS